MRLKKTHIMLTALLCYLAAGPLRGQQRFLAHSDLELNVGAMNYIGDLNNQSMFGRLNMGYGLGLRYRFDDRWAIRIGGAYGHIEGGNPDAIEMRDLSFKSYVGEITARAEFNFLPYGFTDLQWRFTPYLFGGVGVLFFNPTASYEDPITGKTQWADLRPLCTEGQGSSQYPDRTQYSLAQVTIPFGLGVRFSPSKHIQLAIEYGWRKTFTDYLDDVSKTYVESSVLQRGDNGDLAVMLADRSEVRNAAGIKRGDDSLDDWYAFMHASVSISLDLLFGWMVPKKCNPYD